MSHASNLADRSLNCPPVSCCCNQRSTEPPTGLTLTEQFTVPVFYPPGARLEFNAVLTDEGSLTPSFSSVIAGESGVYLISYSVSVQGPPPPPPPPVMPPATLVLILRVNGNTIGIQAGTSPIEIVDTVVFSLKAGDVVDLVNGGNTGVEYIAGTTPHLTIARIV